MNHHSTTINALEGEWTMFFARWESGEIDDEYGDDCLDDKCLFFSAKDHVISLPYLLSIQGNKVRLQDRCERTDVYIWNREGALSTLGKGTGNDCATLWLSDNANDHLSAFLIPEGKPYEILHGRPEYYCSEGVFVDRLILKNDLLWRVVLQHEGPYASRATYGFVRCSAEAPNVQFWDIGDSPPKLMDTSKWTYLLRDLLEIVEAVERGDMECIEALESKAAIVQSCFWFNYSLPLPPIPDELMQRFRSAVAGDEKIKKAVKKFLGSLLELAYDCVVEGV